VESINQNVQVPRLSSDVALNGSSLECCLIPDESAVVNPDPKISRSSLFKKMPGNAGLYTPK